MSIAMHTAMDTDRFTDTAEMPTKSPHAEPQLPHPPSALVHVDLAALSHQGRVRTNNEDRYLAVRAGRYLRTLATNVEAGLVPDEFGDTVYGMAVADGMGGMAAGEVASRLALTTLLRLVLDTPDWIFGAADPQMAEVLNRAARRFRDVNETLIDQAERDPELAGMGTTLTLVCSLGVDAFIAHVGDSRVYLARQGTLHRLTRDHTVAQELADRGAIPAQEIAAHRLRHCLTRVLGREAGGKPEIQRITITDGDRLLLCTDGLTEMVDEPTISAELRRAANAAEACRFLVDRALESGGTDNVTVIVGVYRIAEAP